MSACGALTECNRARAASNSSRCSVNNMILFGPDGKIKKYDDVLDIMRDFYTMRLDFYNRRKAHLTELLTEE